ncbi:hypothetical protein HPP92_004587 [Vanilla planifolia]|uniref:Uncharacterized protein n=1 Tax=Vanilla planifolia TaxID=51239 RepID=A0A835RX14_VANPL|nr:hypothetical protein HPP92_004587 [Vanilla planifolia]
MRSKTDRSIQGEQQIERFKGDGPNWILIAGGALLSTLSIRFVCKLKQAFEARGANRDGRKDTNKCGNGVACQLHSDMCCIAQEKSNCIHCSMGDAPVEIKQASNAPISKDSDLLLPLVKLSKKHPDGCTMWASSPELLELSNRPFHPSTGSESPSISETGSDIYTKREVIQKLRQQLKKRDEMILEMQNQIADLQNSLSSQASQVTRLRSQLDATNRELFVSDREIQRLRKIVANNCLLRSSSPEKLTSSANWQLETSNVYYSDCLNDLGMNCVGGREKVKGDWERMELEKEIGELREVAQGKDFLLQSYKEQTAELCSTIKELEFRLESEEHNTI